MNKIRLQLLPTKTIKPATRFNIKIKPKRSSKYVLKNVEAVIIEENNKYYVRLDIKDKEDFEDFTKIYEINKASYETKGKDVVWRKDGNRYIKIIRFPDESKVFPFPMSIPFRPGMHCIGSVITDIDGVSRFNIKTLVEKQWME